MSLKAFHVFFVAISVLLTVGFGVWALRNQNVESGNVMLLLGIGSLAASVALVVYGVWFLRKLKNATYV